MGLRAWIARLTRAVDTEYDRRIRRASNVAAYGAHGHAHVHEAGDEDDGAVIVNLAPGTPARSAMRHEEHHQLAVEAPERLSTPDSSSVPSTSTTVGQHEEDDAEEAEIVNLPRGAPVRPHEA